MNLKREPVRSERHESVKGERIVHGHLQSHLGELLHERSDHGNVVLDERLEKVEDGHDVLFVLESIKLAF